jgi:hypothetical protein
MNPREGGQLARDTGPVGLKAELAGTERAGYGLADEGGKRCRRLSAALPAFCLVITRWDTMIMLGPDGDTPAALST